MPLLTDAHGDSPAYPLTYLRTESLAPWSTEDDTIYRDRYGNEVRISGNLVLLDPGDVHLDTAHSHWLGIGCPDTFDDWLAARTTIYIETIKCEWCGDHEWEEDSRATAEGSVCETCWNDVGFTCENCHENYHNIAMNTAYHGDAVLCDGCVESSYTFCEYCDTYVYAHDDDHYHNSSACECSSASYEVAILRVDGSIIGADETVTVRTRAGVIDRAGISRLTQKVMQYRNNLPVSNDPQVAYFSLLRDPDYAGLSEAITQIEYGDRTYKTAEGKWHKRLRSLIYKTHGYKMPESLIADLGQIAAAHSTGTDVNLTFTRDFSGGPAAFAHDGSCWWTDYSRGLCVFRHIGGYGLRTWGSDRYEPEGRAWVVPMREHDGRLVPTYQDAAVTAWCVFNAYGEIAEADAARIMTSLVGGATKKVGISGGYMYVNGNAGYLVGAPQVLDRHEDVSFYDYNDDHFVPGVVARSAAPVPA